MRQAVAALFGAAITVAACYATGALVLRKLRATLRRWEQIPLAFALGAACLHLAIFAIFASHLAYKPILWLILLAPILASGAGSRPASSKMTTPAGREPAPLYFVV